MSDTIEKKCISKGVKLTEQRKVIAKVLSESKENYGESDHPDVSYSIFSTSGASVGREVVSASSIN